MVNDKLMEDEHLRPYKLLILPNIAALSDDQCTRLRKFVEAGGSVLATYETSLYNEEGKPRADFGLSDVFGVSYDQGVEGPLQNSYLRQSSTMQSCQKESGSPTAQKAKAIQPFSSTQSEEGAHV